MTVRSAGLVPDALVRRYREFRLIARDPVLLGGLLVTGAFILAFVVWPLARVIWQGFFTLEGAPSLVFFQRYFDPTFALQYWQIFSWTIQMGVLSAIGSTAVGFLFAYTVVRCNIPFKSLVHGLTLLPTISPPFFLGNSTSPAMRIAPAVGRIVSELVLEGACHTYDISLFRHDRFAAGDLHPSGYKFSIVG